MDHHLFRQNSQDPSDEDLAPRVLWQEHGQVHQAGWAGANRHCAPDDVVIVDDRLRADQALKLARRNRALLWRGDYRNARQLLAAMKRRLDRRPVQKSVDPAETFRLYRDSSAYRARVLNLLLVEFGPDYRLDLPHAPEVSQACVSAFGPAPEPVVIPLSELLGAMGAHQWRVRGVDVSTLDNKIHPHYGVFAPTRQEYLDLVSTAPWSGVATAFDIGTGTGVLSALLARRGAERVVATDIHARAVACARDNIDRLGLANQVRVVQTDLFPEGRANLVVCNPPWLPGVPKSTLDAAIYDPNSQMLRRFLHELPHHLRPEGEAWLIMSDLAEHLNLRTRDELTKMFSDAGLSVLDRLDTRPRHRVSRTDPLAEYRALEITSLWRLAHRG